MNIRYVYFFCSVFLAFFSTQVWGQGHLGEASETGAKHPSESGASPADVSHDPLQQQNAAMIQAALNVAQFVDSHKLQQLWDGASVVAKKAVPRDEFEHQIENDRLQLGALELRGQGSVSRVRYDSGGRVPQGMYVNVSFPTRFAKVNHVVRELVSFRLDDDHIWRLSGYSVRAPIQ